MLASTFARESRGNQGHTPVTTTKNNPRRQRGKGLTSFSNSALTDNTAELFQSQRLLCLPAHNTGLASSCHLFPFIGIVHEREQPGHDGLRTCTAARRPRKKRHGTGTQRGNTRTEGELHRGAGTSAPRQSTRTGERNTGPTNGGPNDETLSGSKL